MTVQSSNVETLPGGVGNIFSIKQMFCLRIQMKKTTQGHSMRIFVKKMVQRCGVWQIKPHNCSPHHSEDGTVIFSLITEFR